MSAFQLTFQNRARLIFASAIFSQSNVIEYIKASEILLTTYILTLNNSTETMINSVFSGRNFISLLCQPLLIKISIIALHTMSKILNGNTHIHIFSGCLKCLTFFYTLDFHLELYKEYCWEVLLERFEFPKSWQSR